MAFAALTAISTQASRIAPCSRRNGCAPESRLCRQFNTCRWPGGTIRSSALESRSPAKPDKTAARASAGVAASASSSRECWPSPVMEGRILAIDDERAMIEQDHADFVVDVEVRRERQTLVCGKNPVRGEFDPCSLDTLKTSSPLVPSLGLTTRPSGFSFRCRSMVSQGCIGPTYLFSAGLRSSVWGTQATPQNCRTSEVAALSLARRCAIALFSPRSYPSAKWRLFPRCRTSSHPSDLDTTAMSRAAQYFCHGVHEDPAAVEHFSPHHVI